MQKRSLLVLTALLAVVASVTIPQMVFAQEELLTPTEIGTNAGIGSISGILWGGLGWAVSKSRGRTFEPMNFLSTVIIGVVITAVATLLNQNVADVEGMLFAIGITAIVDKIFGFIQKPNQPKTT